MILNRARRASASRVGGVTAVCSSSAKKSQAPNFARDKFVGSNPPALVSQSGPTPHIRTSLKTVRSPRHFADMIRSPCAELGHGSVHFGSLSPGHQGAAIPGSSGRIVHSLERRHARTFRLRRSDRTAPRSPLTAPWRTAAERAALSSPPHHRQAALPKRPEQAAWRRRGPAACPAAPPRAFRPSPG
jgi:hypothetical protein